MTLIIKIINCNFIIDIDNFKDLCNNKSQSTSIIRWKLDKLYRPYHFDNNGKTIYLIDKIMQDKCHDKILFKDKNKFNYCKNNIITNDSDTIFYYGRLYKIISIIKGITQTMGKSAGILKNSIKQVQCIETNKILYLMECNNDYTIISKNSINKVKKFNNKIVSWYKLSNGYIGAHVKINQKGQFIPQRP